MAISHETKPVSECIFLGSERVKQDDFGVLHKNPKNILENISQQIQFLN